MRRKPDRDYSLVVLAAEIDAAKAEFGSALGARQGAVEWRSDITLLAPAEYVCREARGVDAVITGSCVRATRGVNLGDLVMEAGRPILTVPPDMPGLTLGHVVVAWKDTREARRAVLDSLPLLKAAESVLIVEMVGPDESTMARRRVEDLAVWLVRHGVGAKACVHGVNDAATDLEAFARQQHADLVVAGAYGHSRLREWVLGGFTRDLLANTARCSMVSH